MILGDTIIPWLMGTLLLLALITAIITIKSWREMKQSPYFFLRRQAEKRMQSYSQASLILVILTAGIFGYAWQTPPDTISRVAILTNAKPPKQEIIAAVEVSSQDSVDEVVLSELVSAEVASSVSPVLVSERLNGFSAPVTDALPAEYDNFEPAVELSSETNLGQLAFSTDIDSKYSPVNPRQIFSEGRYTLYATFDYSKMDNGLEWAWVWRHNGAVIDGGNELWSYGSDGPGYIFLNPDEGFQNGEYELQVWVNGEVLVKSSVVMNDAAIAAGN